MADQTKRQTTSHTEKPGSRQQKGEALAEVQSLYDAGRYLDAHHKAATMDLYRGSSDVSARVLAGRLALQLGATRLGRALHFFTWRKNPGHAEACYYYAATCLIRRGPFFLFEFLERHPLPKDADRRTTSHMLGLQAVALALLRDFERAHVQLDQADRVCEDDPWLSVERSHVYLLEDRLSDAEGAARKALALEPWFRPGVQQLGRVLGETDRIDEAIGLFSEARLHLQCASVLEMLGYLLSERGDHAEALRASSDTLDLLPLIEPAEKRQIRSRQARAAYLLSDLTLAAKYAAEGEDDELRHLAERLAQAGDSGIRRELDMGFVRQHYMTCAPATLSAIAKYWGIAVDHDALSHEICYGGTTHHNERAWAERQGFVVREFTVTLEATRTLIDRGLPFTLTTLDPTSGHLQAVYGYDTRLGTVIIRDPSSRYSCEYEMDDLLRRYGSSGPRGLVFVPVERADQLADFELPDAAFYDRLHELERALEVHDRETAAAQLDALRALDPEHRLTIQAASRLAIYDGDRPGQASCFARLLDQFPDDERLAFYKALVLRDLAARTEVVDLLRSWTDRKDKTHPAFWAMLADWLCADARTRTEARCLLRRAIAAVPLDGTYQHLLADLLWEERQYERAIALYRSAACLNETDEEFASEYFRAARLYRHGDEALGFLHDRAQRYAKRSAEPTRTYFLACEDVSREEEGFRALSQALESRPEDGDLMLYAAELMARRGRMERVDALLQSAERKAHRADWLRVRATIARYRAEVEDPLPCWQELTNLQPLNLYAQNELARCLRETQGDEAVLGHLQSLAERFPHHFQVAQLVAEWHSALRPETAEAALRRLVAVAPDDPSAQRELAWYLAIHGRTKSAWEETLKAEAMQADVPPLLGLRGYLRAMDGDLVRARADFRRALEIDVDYAFAIEGLLNSCEDLAQRREALRFVRDELIRQVIQGQGLIEFRERARAILPPDEVMGVMRDAHAARPELPDSWVALARELVLREQLVEAKQLCEEAVRRFPYHARLWLELAAVTRSMQDGTAQRVALTRAVEVDPASTDAGRELASLLLEEEDFEAAEAVVRRLIAREPLECRNHGYLAQLHYQRRDKPAAIEALRKAVQVDPRYEWAWDMLSAWASEAGQAELPLALARDMTRQRPGDATSWLSLARRCAHARNLDEFLQATARAIELSPQLAAAYDLRAEVLADHQRWDEAIDACSPKAWTGPLPVELGGRRCWIDARRGLLQAAIEGIRYVLEQVPDYTWGWRQLADWCESAGDKAGNVQASRELVRLAPQESAAHGYLASALMGVGERAEAKAHFKRSVELDPSYEYGVHGWFDLCLEDGELDAAQRAMHCLQRYAGDSEDTVACAVKHALARGDGQTACDDFRRLYRQPPSSVWAHRAAMKALLEAGHQDDVDRILDALLEDPEADPKSGFLWAERACDGDWLEALDRASERDLGPAGPSMLGYLIEAASERGKIGKNLDWVNPRRAFLRKHTRIWGAVGYVMVLRDGAATIEWMTGWEQREDLESWMLHNLAIAHELRSDFTTAAKMRSIALELPPDHTVDQHRIWGAMDAALIGDYEHADRLLQALASPPLEDAQLIRMIQALAEYHRWGWSNPADAWRQVARARRAAKMANRDDGRVEIACREAIRLLASKQPWWRLLWLRVRF